MERSPGNSSSCSGGRRIDGREDVRAGAPVIFRKIDLDPREPAAVDNAQRAPVAESVEGGGQPRAELALADQTGHLLDEDCGASGAEFRDPDVLPVRLV